MKTTSTKTPTRALAIRDATNIIILEIISVLSSIDEAEVESLVRQLLKARTIVACGAGRVGMAVRGFTMRLGHFGIPAYFLGDATVPAIGRKDLLLVASGSGETQTVYDIVALAKKNGAHIALVTGNPDSRMGKLADTIVVIKAPSKTKPLKNMHSQQPMTTLNEQCLSLFFDAVVLCMMARTGQTHDDLWARHSNLE